MSKIGAKSVFILVLCLSVFSLGWRFAGNLKYLPKDVRVDQPLFSPDASYSENRVTVRSVVEDQGLDSAYQAYKEAVVREPLDTQHQIGHILGELVYDQLGLAGVGECDASFSYGCYHAFFLSAISDHGLEVIEDLGQECMDVFGPPPSSLGCEHGVGHGLGELLGPDKVREQLDHCQELMWDGAYFGCQSGVIMEYNFPTIITADEVITNLRPLEEGQQFSPCESLPEAYRKSCYYETPQWWFSHQVSFEQAENWCLSLASPYQEDCMRGMPYGLYPHIGFDAEAIYTNCLGLSSERSQMLCVAGLAWTLYVNPETQPTAFEECSRLPEYQVQECLAWSDMIGIQ